jgi:hypothetical protein
MLLCKTCDAEVQPGQTFCVNCGSRVEGNTYSPDAPGVLPSADPAHNVRETPAFAQPEPGRPPVAAGTPSYAPPPVASPPSPIAPPAPGQPTVGYGQAGAPYTPPTAQSQTSTGAIVSLIFGLLGLFFVLPLIGPIVGIFAGHMARRNIRESDGRLSGDGLALAGMITGYIGLAFSLIFCGIILIGILAALGQ